MRRTSDLAEELLSRIEMREKAETMAKSYVEAFEKGWDRGMASKAREILISLLYHRFGPQPESVIARIERAGPEWCDQIVSRLIVGETPEQLGLTEGS